MAATWKTVRVFISSTFRDMHAERDQLIKVTFLALREKLLHRVELYEIDLRGSPQQSADVGYAYVVVRAPKCHRPN